MPHDETDRQIALDTIQRRYERAILAAQADMERTVAPWKAKIDQARAAYHAKTEPLRLACDAAKRAVHARFKDARSN